MTTALFPELAPLTFSWGFIRADPARVQEHLRSWLLGIGIPCVVGEMDRPLGEALRSLPPLTLPPSKRLLVATRAGWTACFDNGAKGADLLSFMTILTDRLRCEGLVVRCANDRRMYSSRDRGDHFTHLGFEFFRPGSEPSIGPERAVALSQYYGKWKFTAGGPPLSGEDVSRYEVAAAQDRLTLDLIDSCCRPLGLVPFDPEFYLPQGYIADSHTGAGSSYAISLSLPEAGAVFSQAAG